MTLRERILLAQGPLLVAVALTAVLAVAAAPLLGRSSSLILRDNFRSVEAAYAMREALGRAERAALRQAAGDPAAAAEIDGAAHEFARELAIQEANVTERGEFEVTTALRASWDRLQGELRASAALGAGCEDVRHELDRLLVINREAMLAKSVRTQQTARRLGMAVVLAGVLACGIGLGASFLLTTRLLRPLSVLGQAARRLGQGDMLARARVDRRDELGDLARDFNTMADRLAQFRNSSLGELLEAEQQAQAAIDSFPDPVLILDREGALRASNRAAMSLLGLAADSPSVPSLARHGEDEGWAACAPGVRAAIERVHQAVVQGHPIHQPAGFDEAVRVETSEGLLSYLPRASGIFGERGELRGVSVTFQDVTRARRFDELKNDLVATAAHEFRTPLTSLRMAVHLCLEKAAGPLTEKQLDLLYGARQDTERLQQLVDDLLDLSKIQSGRVPLNRAPCELELLVDEAFATLASAAREKNVTFRAEILPGTSPVWADGERLALVLANLLGNAFKHSPTGATVTVRAGRVGAATRIEVADQGPGIPAAYRRLVFDKFFRVPGAPSGGAGLGLYLVKEIVQAHGGRLGVEPGPGEVGSVFWLELPASPDEGATAAG